MSAEAEARLLTHFLPSAVIRELRAGVSLPFTREVPELNILFADIVGFTKLCSDVRAERVVGTLHKLFAAFDQMLAPLGIFKMDTVGAHRNHRNPHNTPRYPLCLPFFYDSEEINFLLAHSLLGTTGGLAGLRHPAC